MAIKLSFKKNISENKIKNYILFSDENFKIMGINAISLAKQSNLINKIIANNKSKDKNFLLLNINSTQNVILIKLQSKISSFKNEKLGAEFYSFIKSNSIFSSTFIDNNIREISKKNKFFLDEFFHGAQLKSYEFNKYKTKKKK